MILRRLKKATSAKPTPLGIEDARRLAPFRGVHEYLLQSLATNSHVVTPPVGPWEPEHPDEELYFLRKGSMRFSEQHPPIRMLKHDTPAAAYPIPTDEKWAIDVAANTEIMAVPARYLELENSSHTNQESVELLDDEVGSSLYVQFYEAVKSDSFELPSLPDLAVRIGKAIDDPNTMNEDIGRLIQVDPSLTARVMGVVNSAAFGAAEPIRNLNQAIARLGRQQVRNLVFSCIIKGLFRTTSPLLKNRMNDLWRHSARVAAISFVLARVTPGLDPNRAMLAGLIHDIGAIPIMQLARENSQVNNDAELLDSLIDSLKGEVGALTLGAWHFDGELVALTREAEHWLRVGNALPDYLDVVLLAQLHAQIGDKPNPKLPPIDQVPAFSKLALGQLTPQHSIGVLHHAAKDIEEVERMLSMG